MSWQEYARLYLPGATCLAFDTQSELLWSGTLSGHVSSLIAKPDFNFSRYTAYRGHLPGPTKEVVADDRGVLSVGGSIKLANRRGLTLWSSYASACFSNASSSEIVAGGLGILGSAPPDIVCINAATGTTIRKVPVTSPVSFVRRSKLICCGHADGEVVLHDPRSLASEHSFKAHASGLSGLETDGNLVYTYGYSLSRRGTPIVDPIVKVFDVRNLRSMAPVSFPHLPAFMRPHPRNSSTIVVVSAQGHIQVSDINNPTNLQFYNIETDSYLTAMAMSSTGEGMAFTDADGSLHVWSSVAAPEVPRFSRSDIPIDLPQPPEPPRQVNWATHTPLSEIGMPFYNAQLLSVLPWENYSTPYSQLGQAPRKIDPAILASMKTVDFVGYALNPKTHLRNQALLRENAAKEAKRKMDVPLFRSEKERAKTSRRRRSSRGANAIMGANVNLLSDNCIYISTNCFLQTTETGDESDLTQKIMPKYYRKVEIKYSKFGVDDFDFAFYNKTPYSGLETHIVNSYTNALLQAYRFLEPLRKLAESHIWTDCARENCFLCEAGFLFKILQDAGGINCQASNFSKVFSSSSQGSNKFIQKPAPAIQGAASTAPSPLTQLVALSVRTTSSCSSCGHRSHRDNTSNVLDFVYPRQHLSNETPPPRDFFSIFKASIARENVTRSICPACRKTTAAKVRRQLTGAPLPTILAVNTAVHTSDHMQVWLDTPAEIGSRFLQPRIGISALGDRVVAVLDNEPLLQDGLVVYELQSIIAQIQAIDDPAHLVTLVKRKDGAATGWYLFNDFLVKPISEEEALSFPGTWKIPAVLYYQRIDAGEAIDLSALEVTPDYSILTSDVSMSKHRRPALIKHTILKRNELPGKGTLISIDAEFVSLQQEEIEYRSDGTKSLIRPSRMTLARVSVLRGEGPETGVPFIDDHIQVTEPIVDYLTEFSGIRPGDLDNTKSPHTVVPSKVAYKKLRLLVDMGCVFIGHGLNKDFRIINIHVPPEQIVDTVNIYHLAHRHRKISLRFLSWVVLHQDIQSSGSHDSVEDARTALQLYEKYNQLEAQGDWESTLEDIYREGGKLGWKAPGATTVEPPAVTPNISHRLYWKNSQPQAAFAGLQRDMSRLAM
ncbi:poly(A)-specific ribonuclease [Cystobasidiomycetes sp. EMM_F5]